MITTLPLKDGKALRVISAHIEVASNPHIPGGFSTTLRAVMFFPGGRKAHSVSIYPQNEQGDAQVRPLYGYLSRFFYVPRDAYRAFVRSLPVTTWRLDSNPPTLTPALVELAYRYSEFSASPFESEAQP